MAAAERHFVIQSLQSMNTSTTIIIVIINNFPHHNCKPAVTFSYQSCRNLIDSYTKKYDNNNSVAKILFKI